jgi:CheY-like chemotaxis protein
MAKILLVEDDTNLSEIYQARMEAEGYTVVAAPDGESALALAAKEKPELIISDVMMPKISGFEMLDILRNTDGLKSTPVIMLTALGQAEDRTRAEHLGADKYLVKSQVTLEDIVTAAKELLGESKPLPTPAELAAPAISQPAAASGASDDTQAGPTAPATDAAAPAAQSQVTPAQPAPTGPLTATTPAALPAAEPIPTPVTASPTSPVADDSNAAAVSQPAASDNTTLTPDEPVQTPAAAVAMPVVEPPAPATVAPADPITASIPLNTTPPTTEPTPAQPVTEPASAIPASLTPAAEAINSAYSTLPQTNVDDPASSQAGVPAPEPTPALQTFTPAPAIAEPASALTTEAIPAEVASVATGTTASPPPAAPAQSTTAPGTQPIDENMVADAIDKLLAKSPAATSDTTSSVTTTSAVAPTAPSTASEPAAKSEVHRTRVITPPSHSDAPTLQDLLAKEESLSGPGAQPTVTAPAPVTQATAAAPTDPDAAALAQAQAAKAGQSQPAASGFDPGSMTL